MKTLITALAMSAVTLGAWAQAGPGQMVFSYDTGDSAQCAFGTGKREAYDVAVCLHSADLGGATVREVRVPVGPAYPKMADLRLWASTSLDAAGDLLSIAVTGEPDEKGCITLALPRGLAVPGDADIYLGYSFTLSQLNNDAKTPLVVVPHAQSGDCSVRVPSRSGGAWADMADAYGYASAMQLVLDGMSAQDASISDVKVINAAKGTPLATALTLRQRGYTPLSDFDYTYTLCGRSETRHVELEEPLEPRFGVPATVEIALPAVEIEGHYQALFAITKVNGNAPAWKEQKAGEVNIYHHLAHKTPLMEEYGGMTCGNCPRGIAGIEYMKEKYGSEFIAVSIHVGDDLQNVRRLPSPVNSQPTCMLDRTLETDPYFGEYAGAPLEEAIYGIERSWLPFTELIAPADIAVKAYYAASGAEIQVEAAADFIEDTPEPACHFEYMAVGDGLTDPHYYQTNYYNKNEDARVYPGIADYVDQPHTIMPFTYSDVCLSWSRDQATSQSGAVSGPVSAGEPVHDTYTFATPKLAPKAEQMRVVAMLVDDATGHVLNAAETPVYPDSGVGAVTGTGTSEPVYYDLTGSRVGRPASGIYIKVQDGRATKVLFTR